MNFYLGVDIGTTNIKSVLFDELWNEVFSVSSEVITKTSFGGCSEQSPATIVLDVDLLVERCMVFAKTNKLEISAIGLSSAMHSFLAVDDEYNPISELLIWSDTRAYQYSKDLKKNKHFERLSGSLNIPVHPMLPLVKWLWFNENRTESAHKVISLKDYLMLRWFGKCVTDISTASSTGCFNIFKMDWNRELLLALGLPVGKLPEIKATTEVFTEWTESYLQKFKGFRLPPVVIGASDGCLANLAAGVVDSSMGSLTIGTSGAIRTVTKEPVKGNSGLFCYPVLENYFITGGATNNGGNILQWFQASFGIDKATFWPELEKVLKSQDPLMDQLLFMPYIFGERAPLWEPEVKGAYLGISNLHKRKHFLKASAEGVAFSLKHILSKLVLEDNNITTLVADGGFSKSNAWVQLVSDVLGVKIEVPKASYGAAKGAAMLSRLALTGENLSDIIYATENKSIFYPDKEDNSRYNALFAKYLKASEFIVDYFTE